MIVQKVQQVFGNLYAGLLADYESLHQLHAIDPLATAIQERETKLLNEILNYETQAKEEDRIKR